MKHDRIHNKLTIMFALSNVFLCLYRKNNTTTIVKFSRFIDWDRRLSFALHDVLDLFGEGALGLLTYEMIFGPFPPTHEPIAQGDHAKRKYREMCRLRCSAW